MCTAVGRVRKTNTALVTNIWFLPRMCPLVNGETARSCASVIADATSVGLLTCVRPLVATETATLGRTGTAAFDVALKGFLACVRPLVNGEMVQHRTTVTAPVDVALKGFLARVRPLVPGEVAQVCKTDTKALDVAREARSLGGPLHSGLWRRWCGRCCLHDCDVEVPTSLIRWGAPPGRRNRIT